MSTLYVENVPDPLYEALRAQAHANRRSIAAEVLILLRMHIVTPAEKKARLQFFRRIEAAQKRNAPDRGETTSAEEMQREGRQR